MFENQYIKPNKERMALVTIDVQNDFTLPGAPAEISGTIDVIPKIKRVIQYFRKNSQPIIHIVRLYYSDGSNAELCRKLDFKQGKRIVALGSEGAELVEELKPAGGVRLDAEKLLKGDLQQIGEREWILYKPRWGAFYQTVLDEHLKKLEIDSLVFCGCNFPNCPRTSIYEASERDYKIILITDAVSGVYQKGLDEMANIGVNLMDTERFLEWSADK